MADFYIPLLVVALALAVITVVGHGIWSLLAWLFGGARRHERNRVCVYCGRNTALGEDRCGWCGKELGTALAEELADLEATERQLQRLLRHGTLKPDVVAKLRERLQRYRSRLLEPASAKPSAAPVRPRTAAAPLVKQPCTDGVAATSVAETPIAKTPVATAPVVAALVGSPPADISPAHDSPSPRVVPAAAAVPAQASRVAQPQVQLPVQPPAPPRKSWAEMLAGFMEERNIRWGELIGGLLIVGSSVALVLSLWDTLKEIRYFPFLAFVTVSAAVFGVGLYAHHRWKLESTSRGVLAIATLLVPLNFLAMAGLSAGQWDAGTLVMELLSLGAFAWLVSLAGKVLVPGGRWWQVLAVVGNSAVVLLIAAWLRVDSNDLWYLAAGLLPATLFAAAVGSHVAGVSPRERLDAPQAAALLTLLGTAAFALSVAMGMLIVRAAGVAAALDRLAVPIALAAMPVVACGLTLRRGVARDAALAGWHVAGTTVALVGAFLMLAALGLAWPRPLAIVTVGVLDCAALALAALHWRMPSLHAGAIAAAALAYLTGFHVVLGHLPLMAGEVNLGLPMLHLMTGATSGTALVGLLMGLAAVSEWLSRHGRHRDSIVYAGGAGAVAAIGLLLVTFHGLWGTSADALQAAILYALYGTASLALTSRWRRAELTYLGLSLLTAAPIWALWWHPATHHVGPLWASVLAAEALAMGLVAAGLQKFASRAAATAGLSSSLLKKGDRHLEKTVFFGISDYRLGASPLFQQAASRDLYCLPLLHVSELVTAAATALAVAAAWLDRAAIATEHSPALVGAAICIAALYLLLAWQYRSPQRTWHASIVALVGLTHTLTLNYANLVTTPWLVAPLGHATCAVLAGVALEEWVRRRAQQRLDDGSLLGAQVRFVLSRPLGDTALLSSVLALPAIMLTSWANTMSLAWCLFWLAGVWLLIAWRHRNAALFSSHQVVLALATAVGTTAWLQGQAWVASVPADLLHPQSLQAYAAAWALLGFAWLLARILLRHNDVADGLFNPGWPSVDWIMRHLVVVAQLLPIVLALLPGVGEELLRSFGVPARVRSVQLAACGSGAWLVLGISAAMMLAAVWQRWGRAELTSSLLLAATLPCLAAGRFAADLAVASALRWGLAFCVVVVSIAIWQRMRLLTLVRLAGAKVELTAGGPRIARAILLMTTAVPVVALTVWAAMLQLSGTPPGGPLGGTLFARLGANVSYVVPLALVLAGLVGFALRESSAEYAFAGGLVAELIVTLGYALSVVTDPSPLRRFGTTEFVTLFQLATITAAVWALVWLIARLRVNVWRESPTATAKGRDRASFLPSALMNLQIGMGTAGNMLLIVAAAFVMVAFPLHWQAWSIAAGRPLGWFALLLVPAAGGYRRFQQGRSVSTNAVGLTGMAAMVLLACTVRGVLPLWGYDPLWGYRTLMLGWAAYALFIVLAMWWVATVRTLPGAEGPPQVLIRAAAAWVRVAGILAVFLGLKAAIFHPLPEERLWAAAAIAVASGAGAAMAVWRRREGWAFSAALGTNLAASLVVWYFHRNIDYFGDWWLSLVQANVIASAAVALVWLAARKRLYELHDPRLADSPLLGIQVAMPVLGNIAVLVLPVIWLMQQPAALPAHLSRLAQMPGWLGLLLTAAAAAWFLRQSLPGQQVHVVGPLTLGIGVLAACDVANPGGLACRTDWLAYHVLGVSWAAAALIVLGMGMLCRKYCVPAPPDVHSVLPTPSVQPIFPGALVQGWVTLIGVTSLVVAVLHAAADPATPWWSCRVILAASLAAGLMAMWLRLPAYVFVSGLLLNVAGTVAWMAWGPTTLPALLRTNVLCLAAGSMVWSLLRPVHPLGVPHPQVGGRVYSFAHLAAVLAVGTLAAVVVGGVASALFGLPDLHMDVERLDWLAVGLTAAAVAICLWDDTARFVFPSLYFLALAAVGMTELARGLTSRGLCWAATCELAGFALVAGVLGWMLPRLRPLWRMLRIPDQPRRWPVDWFMWAQIVAVASAAALSAWISLDFAFDGMGRDEALLGIAGRLTGSPAALMLVGVAIVMASQAAGARRIGWQCAAFVLGVLLSSSVGWARLDFAAGTFSGDAPWLHRSVHLMLATAMMTMLSSFGLRLAVPAKSDWLAAGRRIAPVLCGLVVLLLLAVLVQEGLLFDAETGTAMAPWAVIVVAAVLVGMIAALLSFALTPRWDPLHLSVRGRTAYVYAAEVFVLLALCHLRLTVPWLFHLGLLARYWMLIVMSVAFAGAALSELFHRRRVDVLADPLARTALLLPAAPAVAFWLLPNSSAAWLFLDNASPALWFLMGLFYSVVAFQRRSPALAALGILAANTGLWVLWHRCGWHFYDRPQLWLIPIALAALLAEHLDRRRLTESQRAAVRYLALGVIYVSSTTEFWRGIGVSAVLPLVTIALAVLGMLAGILLRVRSFLYLGLVFLLVVISRMIVYAAFEQRQIWIFWSCCILLGAAIIALFAVFEKRRNDVLTAVEQFKQWKQ